MEERDYYEVLRLRPSADHDMVVQAYWHLARKYKVAMDHDAFAGRALEELNRAFDVLGSPDSRARYNEAHHSGSPAFLDELGARRLSIEVCFWNLPSWQGMLVAACTIALAAVALVAGARPLLVLCLAAATIVAALLVVPDDVFQGGRIPFRKRWRRKLSAVELERSTSRILADWRKTGGDPEATTSLAELSTSIGYAPRRWPGPKADG